MTDESQIKHNHIPPCARPIYLKRPTKSRGRTNIQLNLIHTLYHALDSYETSNIGFLYSMSCQENTWHLKGVQLFQTIYKTHTSYSDRPPSLRATHEKALQA